MESTGANCLLVLFQALVVYECLSEWGQILCAICPNPKLVITGGTSTGICVWETGTSKERAKSISLKQVKTLRTHLNRNVQTSSLSPSDVHLCLFCVIVGVTGPHGRRHVFDGFIGVPHSRQRLQGSDLHHLGPQQAFLRHTTQGTPSACFCSLHQ